MVVAGNTGNASAMGSIKANTLKLSLFAISSVFVFEFAAGLYTNSLAVLTDSIHALLDAAVTGLLIIAMTLAMRPRDVEHTYGHGRIETVGGFIGGIALFIVAIFFIYEASVRIIISSSASVAATPAFVTPGAFGFAAVIYTLCVDVFRIVILTKATKKTTTRLGGRDVSSPTLKADLYHSFTDFASTAVALAGLWLVTLGFTQADSIAAISLGGFLAFLSSRFAYRNALELTDAITPALVTRVREAVLNTREVLQCKDVKMRRVGQELFVEVTVSLRANMSFENAHEISDSVERNIIESLGSTGEPASASKTMQQESRGLHAENITVHFEPIWSPDLPVESIVEKAAVNTAGVRGVHNILVSKIADKDMANVSLHIQVDRNSSLEEAHAVANKVEESIKTVVKAAENITVHIEPFVPEMRGLVPVSDRSVYESIKNTLAKMPAIREVPKISIYRNSDGILKIDVNCVFDTHSNISGEKRNINTIEQVHEYVSDIEKEIRGMYPSAIITIHTEPEE